MKERIGAFGEMTGLSPETIRYYEQLGLLKPQREHESHYRLYEERDLVQLAQVKQFQGLGIQLADIAEQVGKSDISGVADMITAQRAACEREMEALEDRLARLKGLELDYRRLKEGVGQARTLRVRSMYRLMLSDRAVAGHPATCGMIRELVALMPYAHTTVIVPLELLLDESIDPIPTRYGLGILAHYANHNGFALREPAVFYPMTNDLAATVCVRDFRHITRAELAPLTGAFAERALRIVSDAHALVRHTQATPDGDRYHLSIHASYA